MPFFPDCYDEWGLYKITYDGDHKMYDMLYEGTEEQCRQYAYENYTDKPQTLYDLIADWWDEIFLNNNEAAVTIESLVDEISLWLPTEHDTNSYKWNECIRTIREKLR
jgi:hypothetical protein